MDHFAELALALSALSKPCMLTAVVLVVLPTVLHLHYKGMSIEAAIDEAYVLEDRQADKSDQEALLTTLLEVEANIPRNRRPPFVLAPDRKVTSCLLCGSALSEFYVDRSRSTMTGKDAWDATGRKTEIIVLHRKCLHCTAVHEPSFVVHPTTKEKLATAT